VYYYRILLPKRTHVEEDVNNARHIISNKGEKSAAYIGIIR